MSEPTIVPTTIEEVPAGTLGVGPTHSQPLAVRPSQLAKPGLHEVILQRPPVQLWTATLEAPTQSEGREQHRSALSQPFAKLRSQSKPERQVATKQAPVVQAAEATVA